PGRGRHRDRAAQCCHADAGCAHSLCLSCALGSVDHHAVMTTPAETPFALVDRAKVERNVTRLGEHLRSLGVAQRPHAKTSKALEPTQMVHGGIGPITVSTLAEAEFFADAGYTDILYAVGIAPGKLDRVARLRRRGVDLTILLDTVAQA